MGFYTFSQNSSGGLFNINDSVSQYVIVEADTANEANSIFENIGYFNGCADGIDCPCCGDRWYPVEEYDENDTPMIDDIPVAEYKPLSKRPSPYAHVYYKNGAKSSYSEQNKRK